jgi:CheY-like chemotaxis protein
MSRQPTVTINGNPNTILIVDGDSNACQAMRELCKLEGYDVAFAEHGLAALDKIRIARVRPALILLDLYLPVMGGYAFLYEALKNSDIQNVPIIVMTADLCARPPRADAILRKPLNLELFFRTVRRFLSPVREASSRTGSDGRKQRLGACRSNTAARKDRETRIIHILRQFLPGHVLDKPRPVTSLTRTVTAARQDANVRHWTR